MGALGNLQDMFKRAHTFTAVTDKPVAKDPLLHWQ
jgi:hypothetical protein